MTRKKKPQPSIIKPHDPEIIVRQKPTQDLVSFDFGLMFTQGSKDVQIYIDEDLRDFIQKQLEVSGTMIMKVNFFSPDVIVIVPSAQNDLQGP